MKRLFLTSVALTTMTLRAFNNKPGWKLDADGRLVMNNGNPVYIREDGTEGTVETNTISRLNGEAKSHRERAEAAELKLQAFNGLDAAAARDAIEKLSKIDQKKLIDAGEVEKVREEIAKGFTAQIQERDVKISTTQSRLEKLMLDNVFSGSQFVKERVAIPGEMFRAYFGQNFKIENDTVIAYNTQGQKIYSKQRMGELATPDEAFEILVDGYAHKDAILKAQNHSGSGNNGGGGQRPGSRSITRAEFDKLPPVKQAEMAGLQGKGELTVTD